MVNKIGVQQGVKTELGGVKTLGIMGHPHLTRIDIAMDDGTPALVIHAKGRTPFPELTDRDVRDNQEFLENALTEQGVAVATQNFKLTIDPAHLDILLDVMDLVPGTKEHIKKICDEGKQRFDDSPGSTDIPRNQRLAARRARAELYHDRQLGRAADRPCSR